MKLAASLRLAAPQTKGLTSTFLGLVPYLAL